MANLAPNISTETGWTAKYFLHLEDDDVAQRMAVLRSLYTRDKGLQDIQLRHLRVQMN
jgi:hypothetical protein